MPILEQFQPQIILVSSGFDACIGHPHPLGGYELTPTCFSYMTNQLMKLADGKVVLVLEGGYELNALAECGKACVNALLGREVKENILIKFNLFFLLFSCLHLVKKLLKLNLIYMQYIV